MLNALYELSNIILEVIYFTDNNTKAKNVNLAKEEEPVLNSGNPSSFTCHRTQPQSGSPHHSFNTFMYARKYQER